MNVVYQRFKNPHRLFEKSGSHVSPGVKAVEIFESSDETEFRCMGMEIQPQSSTLAEKNLGPTIGVFVLSCDPDLASFTLNGARMELQVGDHLTIPPETTFMFTNSSLSLPLKLRLVHRFSSKLVQKV